MPDLENNTIKRVMDAYNSRNAHVLASFFASDVKIYQHPDILVDQGREGILAHYLKVFAQYPQASVEVVYSILIGNKVILHEKMKSSPEHESIDVVAIYELKDGLIQRLDFIRA
jgi:uncharacterized protein (TIGR02246 family)